MLHSDVAVLMATDDQRLSRHHIDAARAWVRMLPNDAAGRFKERWQAYAVGPYLVQYRSPLGDTRPAPGNCGVPAQRGPSVDGRYPAGADRAGGDVRLPRCLDEGRDRRGLWGPPSNRIIARIEDGLVAAAAAYQRALDLDPSLLSARLRLGWVYDINHSSTHAREQLRIVADRAASRELRYLAHLILGGLAEQEGRTDLAYEEYDTAHSIQMRRSDGAHRAHARREDDGPSRSCATSVRRLCDEGLRERGPLVVFLHGPGH